MARSGTVSQVRFNLPNDSEDEQDSVVDPPTVNNGGGDSSSSSSSSSSHQQVSLDSSDSDSSYLPSSSESSSESDESDDSSDDEGDDQHSGPRVLTLYEFQGTFLRSKRKGEMNEVCKHLRIANIIVCKDGRTLYRCAFANDHECKCNHFEYADQVAARRAKREGIPITGRYRFPNNLKPQVSYERYAPLMVGKPTQVNTAAIADAKRLAREARELSERLDREAQRAAANRHDHADQPAQTSRHHGRSTHASSSSNPKKHSNHGNKRKNRKDDRKRKHRSRDSKGSRKRRKSANGSRKEREQSSDSSESEEEPPVKSYKDYDMDDLVAELLKRLSGNQVPYDTKLDFLNDLFGDSVLFDSTLRASAGGVVDFAERCWKAARAAEPTCMPDIVPVQGKGKGPEQEPIEELFKEVLRRLRRGGITTDCRLAFAHSVVTRNGAYRKDLSDSLAALLENAMVGFKAINDNAFGYVDVDQYR